MKSRDLDGNINLSLPELMYVDGMNENPQKFLEDAKRAEKISKRAIAVGAVGMAVGVVMKVKRSRSPILEVATLGTTLAASTYAQSKYDQEVALQAQQVVDNGGIVRSL